MDIVLEGITSVPGVPDGVSVGNPERTGIVSVFKLVCWEATVSSVLLTLGVDGTSTPAVPEESIRAEEMACFVVAIRSRDVDLDGS